MLKTFLLGLAVAGGFMLVSAPGADAGSLCNVSNICGDVYNQSRSSWSCKLIVSNGWNNGSLAGSRTSINPGTWAPYKDVDGFMARSGCKTKHTFNNGITWSGWYTRAVKINDATNAKVYTVPLW